MTPEKPRRWPLSAPLAALAVLASPLLGACLEVDGLEYTIDLASHTGHLTVHGIGSSSEAEEAADFTELIEQYVGANALDGAGVHWGIQAWTVRAKRLVDADPHLDGAIDFAWTRPLDVGLFAHDRAHPTAWCPPTGFFVTRANATFRTREGCLVWGAGVTTLRIEIQSEKAGMGRALRARWRAAPPAPGGVRGAVDG